MTKPATAKTRYLPDWANAPLKFDFCPDAALKRGAFAAPPKVQDLKISVQPARKSRSHK